MSKDNREEKKKIHPFWDKQPVGLCDKTKFIPGTITSHQKPDEIPDHPADTPSKISWRNISTSDEQLNLVSSFLNENYVEDRESQFRLQYSAEFLSWFISQGKTGWSFALQHEEDGIIGFVSAVSRKVSIINSEKEIAEVNLLCVHKNHRNENLAPLLIQEVTRRINKDNIFVAIYTCGTKLPQEPFHTSRYFHKLLNVQRLNDAKFTQFPDTKSAIASCQHKKTPSRVKLLNHMDVLRPMTFEDITIVEKMFSAQSPVVLREIVDREKLEKMMSSGDIVQCYVVERIDLVCRTRSIVGFMSTYDLDLLVTESEQLLKTVYLYYHCGEVLEAVDSLFTILQKRGKDIVNCLAVAEKVDIIKTSNMNPGSGILHYYMYNFRLPVIGSNDISYIVF